MKKFIRENRFKAGILILILFVSLSYFLKNNNSDIETLTMKAKCARDGENFISQNFHEFPPDTMTIAKTFNYNSKLKTCLVDIKRKTILGYKYAIYDIYTTQPVAFYTLHNPELGIQDSLEDMKNYSTAKEKYFPK